MLKVLIKDNIGKWKCIVFPTFVVIKKNLYKLTLITFFGVMPVISFAQGTETGNPVDPNVKIVKIINPIKVDSINGLIKTLLDGALTIGIPLIALAIIYCGFLFVQARGNPESITKAKDALLYTLIGAAILLGSWAIAQLINETVLAL